MTQTQFNDSVTQAINVKLLNAQGEEQEHSGICEFCKGTEIINFEPCPFCKTDIVPNMETIAKIPLRAELRAILEAADAYEANAVRLLTLARQAREAADNLKRMANL